MSKFNDNIVDYSKNFESFINAFENLEDMAPFDNNLFKAIHNLYDDSIESNKKALSNLDESIDKYYKNIKNKMTKYYEELDKLNDEIITQKNEIVDKYQKAFSNIQIEIEKMNDENRRKKENHLLDIEYFIIASSQNISMFEVEHKDNITRYNYQKENALQTYQNSIAKNNNYLEQKLQKLKNDFSYSLIDYDVETNNIIKGYNEQIDETNKIVSNHIENFAKVQAEHKENKYKESVDLNDKIRLLVNETNKKKQVERSAYAKNQADNQTEKDQKRNEYQSESQSISREFVYKMNELDESITNIKNDYNQNLQKEKKDLQYRLLDIHKEQEKVITYIINQNESEKSIRRQIRQKNKTYFAYTSLEKNQVNKTIRHLDRAFLIDSENNAYNKKVLELNRVYSLKNINEKELYDNKYYQELNNIEENYLNYKLAVSTNDYNKAANLIRLDSTIRTIDIDNSFEKKDNIHQMELEKLITKIKKVKLDLQSVQDIHKLLHTTEEAKHQKTLNYLVVHNLLEIEKDRVLNDYNMEQYQLNVAKENELLKYSTSNIKLKNYKYKQLKYSQINIEKAILESDIYSLNYKTVLDDLAKKHEIDVSTTNNQFKIDYLAAKILNYRFKEELKSINQIMMNYVSMIKELENNTVQILDTIFDNIVFRPEYLDIVKSFIDKLVELAYNYFSDITNTFIELQKNVVNERLLFEESFKFKHFYDEIEGIYNTEHNALTNRKNELEETLESYQAKITDYNSLIFTIQNQILYIKDPKNYALYNKQNAKKNLTILTNKITNLVEEENDYISKIDPLKNEIETLNIKIKQLDNAYNEKQSEIKRKQYYSAYAFHELIDNFINTINESKKEMYQAAFEQGTKLTAVNYESAINKRKNNVLAITSSLITKLYQNINTFYEAESKEYNDDILGLKFSLKSGLENLDKEYNDLLYKEKVKDSKTRKILASNIRKKNINHINLEKKCDQLIKINNNKHNDNSNRIIEKTHSATERFYDEFYAICANQKSIDEDYNDTIKSLENGYLDAVTKLVENSKELKGKYDNELNTYIRKRKEIIANLPEKTKMDKYTNVEDTKKYNKDIDKNTQDAKTKYIEKRKELNNNIAEINLTFSKNKVFMKNDHNTQLKREKKAHAIQLKRLK